MALYTYVPAKAELVDLMVDACFAAFPLRLECSPGAASRPDPCARRREPYALRAAPVAGGRLDRAPAPRARAARQVRARARRARRSRAFRPRVGPHAHARDALRPRPRRLRGSRLLRGRRGCMVGRRRHPPGRATPPPPTTRCPRASGQPPARRKAARTTPISPTLSPSNGSPTGCRRSAPAPREACDPSGRRKPYQRAACGGRRQERVERSFRALVRGSRPG